MSEGACPLCGLVGCTGHAPAPRHIITLEVTPMAMTGWVADRRLYLDKDGKVVEADDPARATLLVGVGGIVPAADAERYGLMGDAPAVETRALDEPPATKAVTKAPANKSAKAPTPTKTSAKKEG